MTTVKDLETNKQDIDHLEDMNGSDQSSFKEDLARTAYVLDEAKDATQDEHELTVSNAIKFHKKAIFWAIVLSSTIIMVRNFCFKTVHSVMFKNTNNL